MLFINRKQPTVLYYTTIMLHLFHKANLGPTVLTKSQLSTLVLQLCLCAVYFFKNQFPILLYTVESNMK